MPLVTGRMDRRITLERDGEQTGTNAFNEPIFSEPVSFTVWAAKQDVSDRERFTSAEVAAQVTTRFQIRWSSQTANVDTRWRVRYDGRIYDISAVKEIGRRAGLEITGAARAEQA